MDQRRGARDLRDRTRSREGPRAVGLPPAARRHDRHGCGGPARGRRGRPAAHDRAARRRHRVPGRGGGGGERRAGRGVAGVDGPGHHAAGPARAAPAGGRGGQAPGAAARIAGHAGWRHRPRAQFADPVPDRQHGFPAQRLRRHGGDDRGAARGRADGTICRDRSAVRTRLPARRDSPGGRAVAQRARADRRHRPGHAPVPPPRQRRDGGQRHQPDRPDRSAVVAQPMALRSGP